jgi:hypothetical protein
VVWLITAEKIMRARFNPTGLSIAMEDFDIDKTELECIVKGFNNPKILVKIKDTVTSTGNKESQGFHIETIPDKTGFDICQEIYIFIDKQISHQIFHEYDEEYGGGFFMSRSPYDRIDITYWNKEKHRNH